MTIPLDHQPPAETIAIVCSKCGWEGGATLRQVHPGCIASIEGPAEDPSFVCTCGGCGDESDPDWDLLDQEEADD